MTCWVPGVRPYLYLHVVGLSGASGDIPGIIDSGADTTCLPQGFAPLLGYEASDLEHQQGSQVGGALDMFLARKPVRAAIVDLEICEIDLWPTFVDGDQVLWGRRDFFMAVNVTFFERQQSLSLTIL